MKTITFILLIFSSVCHSQIINFPDSNFKNALLNHDPVIDLNGDGEIQVSEAAAFEEEINVNNKNISDLTGIGYFTNIIELRCRDNSLTTLDLSENSLLFLDCSFNLLTSIDVTNNPLWHFWCNNNQLEELDVSFIAELQDLYCSNNFLTNIDLSNSMQLGYLSCDNNLLTNLNISNLPLLQSAYFQNNLITNLNISNSPRLTTVNASNNQIANLTLTNLPRLENVHCSNNLLTSLDISNVDIVELDCSNNQINNIIGLNNSTNLERLNINNTLFNEIDLSNCSELSVLKCSDNPNLIDINLRNPNNRWFNLTESSFYNLPVLSSVCIYDNPINYPLIDLILSQTGHNVNFYTSENCDVLLESPDNQISTFTINPNPVKNILKISSDYNLKNAQIFNSMGQKVFSEKNLNITEINVSDLNNGVYILKLTDDKINSPVKKFIKE